MNSDYPAWANDRNPRQQVSVLGALRAILLEAITAEPGTSAHAEALVDFPQIRRCKVYSAEADIPKKKRGGVRAMMPGTRSSGEEESALTIILSRAGMDSVFGACQATDYITMRCIANGTKDWALVLALRDFAMGVLLRTRRVVKLNKMIYNIGIAEDRSEQDRVTGQPTIDTDIVVHSSLVRIDDDDA